MRTAVVGQETGARYDDMMARYLGPVIVRAFADDDVTEIYLNPQDGVVRFDTCSRGRITSEDSEAPTRVEMFPNAVAGLSGRARCPRFSPQCPIILQTRQRDRSTGRSGHWRSSSAGCAFLRRASWGAGITSFSSWQRAAGCGSLPLRFSRPSAAGTASFSNWSPLVAPWSKGWSSSRSALGSCCGSYRAPCAAPCGCSSYCERFSSPPERAREVRCGVRELI
jgi:hypothetical protein